MSARQKLRIPRLWRQETRRWGIGAQAANQTAGTGLRVQLLSVDYVDSGQARIPIRIHEGAIRG